MPALQPEAEPKPEAAIHSDRRLPGLTGLRIVAALAVYMNHVGAPAGSPALLDSFMTSGYSGVTIFFVLSGFVLSFNYFESLRKPTPAGLYNYFVARFARVYPLYALVLLYFVLKQHAFGITIDGWWQHALAIQGWNPDVMKAFSFDAPAWSVGVEFFLYACFPLLILPLARLRSVRSILVTAAGISLAMLALAAWFELSGKADLPFTDPSSAHRWLYRTPLTRLGDFALGILAARLFVQVGGHAIAARVARPLTWLSIGMIVAAMAWPAMVLSAWSWDVAIAIPAALLIFALAAAPLTLPARALSIPAVVLLGEASYAFYLIHWPAIFFFDAGQWANSVTPSIVLYEAFVLGAILAFAVGVHMTVEQPARRYLRRVLTYGRARPPVSPMKARQDGFGWNPGPAWKKPTESQKVQESGRSFQENQ